MATDARLMYRPKFQFLILCIIIVILLLLDILTQFMIHHPHTDIRRVNKTASAPETRPNTEAETRRSLLVTRFVHIVSWFISNLRVLNFGI